MYELTNIMTEFRHTEYDHFYFYIEKVEYKDYESEDQQYKEQGQDNSFHLQFILNPVKHPYRRQCNEQAPCKWN